MRRSAGVIVFRNSRRGREYLLVQHAKGGHWYFPKGAIERDEGFKKTALRELIEETGLNRIKILEGFCEKIEYNFKEDGQLVHKEAVFFLGRTQQKAVKLSEEHLDYAWLPYQKAIERLTYKNTQQLLKKAEAFLKRQESS